MNQPTQSLKAQIEAMQLVLAIEPVLANLKNEVMNISTKHLVEFEPLWNLAAYEISKLTDLDTTEESEDDDDQ